LRYTFDATSGEGSSHRLILDITDAYRPLRIETSIPALQRLPLIGRFEPSVSSTYFEDSDAVVPGARIQRIAISAAGGCVSGYRIEWDSGLIVSRGNLTEGISLLALGQTEEITRIEIRKTAACLSVALSSDQGRSLRTSAVEGTAVHEFSVKSRFAGFWGYMAAHSGGFLKVGALGVQAEA
jgi:hypothetical protein